MERVLPGVPAAPGIGIGVARVQVAAPVAPVGRIALDARPAEAAHAARALREAAAELEVLATRFRREGRAEEADILEAGALMAVDPALAARVEAAVASQGTPAAPAILDAAEAQAALIDSLDDANLAARASDVRSVGRRAARLAAGGPSRGRPDDTPERAAVVIAEDLGPADVAELEPDVAGLALVKGGITAHAAIVARSLGIPLVVGLPAEVLQVGEGATVIVDGSRGELIQDPRRTRLEAATAALQAARRARRQARANRELPARTRDGRQVRLLANAASPAEVALALDAGAQGIGLLRTELAFLDAQAWPTASQHRAMLQPLFARLPGRVATVRLLDFGGDKTPPFLRGVAGRGIQLLAGEPAALRAQLEAILDAPAGIELRVLVPMVSGATDLLPVRELVEEIARTRAVARPQIGAMIEVPAAAELADRLAPLVDFLSIGTNDLTQFTLGLDRAAALTAPAHHPAVLRLIAGTITAAHAAQVLVDVCGEAASQAIAMPLLLGLGIDELSVGPARLPTVRSWIRSLDGAAVSALAAQALELTSAGEVETLVATLTDLLEGIERGGEGIQGGVGVVPFRAQP